MTAASTSSAPRGRYRFRDVAAMEWIKLVTLRSTWWTLAVTLAGAVAMAWPAWFPGCCSPGCSGCSS